ncbi:Hypothetical protein A7982_10096 [Minicystis rosea]|nr:Hypothetical protein A7982_10096 [Minicystis rosea]
MPSLFPTVRRALPSLLVLWGAALFFIALLNWAHYGVFLRLFLVAR